MSSTAYKVFVMQAAEAGSEIGVIVNGFYHKIDNPTWDWTDSIFVIKLPSGWEYVIEDGEIAFRKPKKGEYALKREMHQPLCICYEIHKCAEYLRPIIKRVTANSGGK